MKVIFLIAWGILLPWQLCQTLCNSFNAQHRQNRMLDDSHGSHADLNSSVMVLFRIFVSTYLNLVDADKQDRELNWIAEREHFRKL